MSEKNKKLRADLIEKVKSLRGHLKTLEDDRRALSAQFAETLETLKKKVKGTSAYITLFFLCRMLMLTLPRKSLASKMSLKLIVAFRKLKRLWIAAGSL